MRKLTVAAVLLLAACGGGDPASPDTTAATTAAEADSDAQLAAAALDTVAAVTEALRAGDTETAIEHLATTSEARFNQEKMFLAWRLGDIDLDGCEAVEVRSFRQIVECPITATDPAIVAAGGGSGTTAIILNADGATTELKEGPLLDTLHDVMVFAGEYLPTVAPTEFEAACVFTGDTTSVRTAYGLALTEECGRLIADRSAEIAEAITADG